jgi:RNA polymerase sigma-70 factor (ECF subfamily)
MRSPYYSLHEEELVLSALVGSLEAFDELVRRYRGAVILVAEQTLGSRAAAEDAAQEAFLLAFKNLPQLEDPSRFAPWLYMITRRYAWRRGQSERRSKPTEPSLLDRLILAGDWETAAHPAEGLLRAHERACVAAALEELPAEYRTILHLRYYEEWSMARIADFLLLPLTTVKGRLYQGRKLLSRRLDELLEEKTDDNES